MTKKCDAEFIRRWDTGTHADKVALADEYGIKFNTARHWRSDSEIPSSSRGQEAVEETAPSTTPIRLDRKGGFLVAVINDMHIPFHDPKIIEAVEGFLAEVQPDILFYDGDILDFYQISDFEKDPARLVKMQQDVDIVTEMFDRQAVLLPKTERWFIIGNHERRLQRLLWTKSPALSSLRCLTLDALLGLPERNIRLVDFEQGVIINGTFLVLHGDITSIHSGYTSKRLYEKHGGCGIAGHCHRAGSYYKRDRFGTWGWWENGCLCNLNPDWVQNPNWTQGFSLIHFRDERFWVEAIPIINGSFLYGGKMYGRKQ